VRLAPELVGPPATLLTACGVAVLLTGLVRAVVRLREAGSVLAAHAGLALELLLAAGLVRLASLDSLRALATVALLVAVRQVLGRGIRLASRG
jgi:uncharacterized membrane protein